MKKLTYPPFITLLATILATFANEVFGIKVDVEMASAAIAAVGSYLVMQFAVDIQLIRRGQMPETKFHSVKFYTALVVSVALGLSNYFKLDLSVETIGTWATFGVAIIVGKGVKDMTQNKQDTKPPELKNPENYYR